MPSASRPHQLGASPIPAIPPLPSSVVDKVRDGPGSSPYAPLTDGAFRSTLQSMKYTSMEGGLDNKGGSVPKRAFSDSLDQQVLKELTTHVDELLSLCSKPSALALAASPKMVPSAPTCGDGSSFVQLPPSITIPTTTSHKAPPALSDLSFLCMQFQVRQEALRQQYSQGQIGDSLVAAEGSASFSDAVQKEISDFDHAISTGNFEIKSPVTAPLAPHHLPFSSLGESHLFQVLCGMAELAFGVAVHVLRFVLRHELHLSLSRDVVINWDGPSPGGEQGAVSGSDRSEVGSSASSGMPQMSSSSLGMAAAEPSTESMRGSCRDSVSSFEDLTKLSSDEKAMWRDTCASLMYHAINILGQVMLAQKSDTTDRERVDSSLEFLADLSGKATHEEGFPSAQFKHACCLRLLRHSSILTMRKRIQYYLLEELGGGRLTPPSSAVYGVVPSRLVEYLSVVLNPTILTREAELACFAQGFKSMHVMVVANLTHNNHVASATVASFPHASLRVHIPEGATPPTPCFFAPDDVDGSPAALKPLTAAESDASSVSVHVGMAGDANTSRQTGTIDILGSILSSTRLDTENPGLAEWSEFVLRGLCGVSIGARSRISGIHNAAKENPNQGGVAAAVSASLPPEITEKKAAPCPPSFDRVSSSPVDHIRAGHAASIRQDRVADSECDDNDEDMVAPVDDVRVGRSESPVHANPN